jgi:hypothetical protein
MQEKDSVAPLIRGIDFVAPLIRGVGGLKQERQES